MLYYVNEKIAFFYKIPLYVYEFSKILAFLQSGFCHFLRHEIAEKCPILFAFFNLFSPNLMLKMYTLLLILENLYGILKVSIILYTYGGYYG